MADPTPVNVDHAVHACRCIGPMNVYLGNHYLITIHIPDFMKEPVCSNPWFKSINIQSVFLSVQMGLLIF